MRRLDGEALRPAPTSMDAVDERAMPTGEVRAARGPSGLVLRRHLDEVARSEWDRCARERQPLSILLLDVDRFGRFADRHGEVAADTCLRALATRIAASARRPNDRFVPFGGQQFLVLLPDTALDGATFVAERIRASVVDLAIDDDAGVVTVSIGVATAWPDGDDALRSMATRDLLLRADVELHRAKIAGRNRVSARAGECVDYSTLPPTSREDDAAQAATQAGTLADLAPATPIDTAYETLVQFLYRAPIGLVQAALDGTVEMMNPTSASLLLTASPDSDLDNLFDVLAPLAPDLREQVASFPSAGGVICDARRVELRGDPARPGPPRILSISLSKLDGTRLMAMISDVTSEVQREQSGIAFHLDAAARTDRLTRLPNRAVACEWIDRAIARAATDPAYEFAVLFLNADRFRQVNDTLGHVVGDDVLRLMADRLKSVSQRREPGGDPASSRTLGDTLVARLGGDEFVVFVDVARVADVFGVADRLLDALAQPYRVESHLVHASVSIGVVVRAEALGDADTVLRNASIAMIEAKRGGGARQVRFEAAMHERARLLGGLEIDLRRALSAGELFVVYQPVVAFRAGPDDDERHDASSGLSPRARSAGVEALVRWNHPVRGLVSPIDFIGVAERCGLIGALGAFVLASACRQFMQWQRTLGDRAPRLLAVNVSRGQLVEPGFADYVAEVLRSTGMPAGRLQLEITESLAAQDAVIQQRLKELKGLGLTLALDDFGTGYSSLASLHELPVDTVKIDRSFVSEAVTSTYHRVLIEATVRVANTLRMNTVAEGIETEAQAALLRELGCDKGQGYLFAKPLGAAELVEWLLEDRALTIS